MLSVQNAMTEFMKDKPFFLPVINSFPCLGADCNDISSVAALTCKSGIIGVAESNNEIKISCVQIPSS
jgi:hypothetical protein